LAQVHTTQPALSSWKSKQLSFLVHTAKLTEMLLNGQEINHYHYLTTILYAVASHHTIAIHLFSLKIFSQNKECCNKSALYGIVLNGV
jgi:hypothetical protein